MTSILSGYPTTREFAAASLVAAGAGAVVARGPWWRRAAGAAVAAVLPTLVGRAIAARENPRATPADAVTLVRSVCAGVAAAAALAPPTARRGRRTWTVAAFAIPAVVLDAVDGYVARRTGTSTADGARLDMETDAAVQLLLSGVTAWVLSPTSLVIGTARYAFRAGGHVRPAWRAPLPPSRRRRAVAGLQGAALGTALAPIVPARVARAFLTAAALALLASFALDIADLERRSALDQEHMSAGSARGAGTPGK